jgi:hypothetical protein
MPILKLEHRNVGAIAALSSGVSSTEAELALFAADGQGFGI